MPSPPCCTPMIHLAEVTELLMSDTTHLPVAIDVQEEIERTRRERRDSHDRAARVLVRNGPLRVTLVTLVPGGHIAPHRAPGPITVHTVAGSIEFETEGRVIALRTGEMLALDAYVDHAVRSTEGGSFLLTMAAPVSTESR